jgi:formate hydrogenlyase subunit 6/NADH:ubiquinone oxidoreductase subunit I
LKCPSAAVKVIKEDKIWQINRLRCVACGYCVEACPKKCLKMDNQYSRPILIKEEEPYRQNA